MCALTTWSDWWLMLHDACAPATGFVILAAAIFDRPITRRPDFFRFGRIFAGSRSTSGSRRNTGRCIGRNSSFGVRPCSCTLRSNKSARTQRHLRRLLGLEGVAASDAPAALPAFFKDAVAAAAAAAAAAWGVLLVRLKAEAAVARAAATFWNQGFSMDATEMAVSC